MSLDIELYVEVDTGGDELHRVTLFEENYTHNCNVMAKEATIYEYVWRPEECGVKVAADLIDPLRDGIRFMEIEPERFRKLNPANGWGSYATFLPWLKKYLAACMEHPKANVWVSR